MEYTLIEDKYYFKKDIAIPVLARITEEQFLELDKTGRLQLDGKLYSWQVVNKSQKTAWVKEFTLKENPEKTHNYDDFECPYCGAKIMDSWEYDRDHEIELDCEVCHNTFYGTADVSVTYRGYVKEND